jgi:hypothetical protein
MVLLFNARWNTEEGILVTTWNEHTTTPIQQRQVKPSGLDDKKQIFTIQSTFFIHLRLFQFMRSLDYEVNEPH